MSEEWGRGVSGTGLYSYNFEWEVKGFEQLLRLFDNGKEIKSPNFHHSATPDIKWCLKVYPAGDCKTSEGHVSVFLCLRECPRHKLVASNVITVNKETSSGRNEFRLDDEGWGKKKMVAHDNLHLQNGFLLVKVRLEYMWGEWSHSTAAKERATPLLHRPADHANLLLQPQLADVQLKHGESRFEAHRAILASHSSVFANMFSNDNWAEAQRNAGVEINCLGDDAQSSIHHFLAFIYTGRFHEDAGDVNYEDMLELGNYYDVAALKEVAEAELEAQLCSDNFSRIAVLAHLHNSQRLFHSCLKLLRGRNGDGDGVMELDEWRSLAEQYPKLVADLSASFINIFPHQNPIPHTIKDDKQTQSQ